MSLNDAHRGEVDAAVADALRHQHREDRRAGDRRVHRDDVALARRGPRLHPHDARRAVVVVLHVLLARPHHLHRRARASPSRSPRPDARSPAAPPRRPKPPPSIVLCTSTFSSGRPARFRRSGHRRLAVLRRRPDLEQAVGLDPGGARLRLHRRVGEVRRAVLGLDHLGGGLRSAAACRRVRAPRRSFGGEPFAQHRRDASRPTPRRWRRHPIRSSASRAPCWRATSCRRRRRRSPRSRTTFFTPRIAQRLGRIDDLHPAAEHRALRDRRVQHAGKYARRRAKTGLPSTLSGMSRRCSGLPAIFQSFGSRSAVLAGGAQPGRRGGHLAVAQPAARRAVRDDAGGAAAFRRGHLPRRGGGRDQHFARGWRPPCARSPATQRTPWLPPVDIEPQTRCRRQVLVRRGELGAHLGPVAIELLGDELRQRRDVPCPISDRAMRMTTRSSGWITIQALTSVALPPAAARATNGNANSSARPPPAAAEAFRKSRRAGTERRHSRARSWRLRTAVRAFAAAALDRPAHAGVGAAAAQVGHRASISASVGSRCFVEQRGRRHDHARSGSSRTAGPRARSTPAARGCMPCADRPSMVTIFLPAASTPAARRSAPARRRCAPCRRRTGPIPQPYLAPVGRAGRAAPTAAASPARRRRHASARSPSTQPFSPPPGSRRPSAGQR